MQDKKPSIGGAWVFSGTAQYMYSVLVVSLESEVLRVKFMQKKSGFRLSR